MGFKFVLFIVYNMRAFVLIVSTFGFYYLVHACVGVACVLMTGVCVYDITCSV